MDTFTSRRLPVSWDWIVGYMLLGVGAAVLAGTAVAVSGSRFVSDQLSYVVSGGLGALVLLGLGAMLLVTAGLSDEWRKLDRIQTAIDTSPMSASGDGAAPVRAARLMGTLGMVAATAFIVPAWFTVSSDTDPKPGLAATTLAVVGLAAGALVTALATLRVQRRIQTRKRDLFAPWVSATVEPSADVTELRLAAAEGQAVIATGLTRFHRPGCPAVRGIDTRVVDLRSLPAALEPCDLCEADRLVREEERWISVAG